MPLTIDPGIWFREFFIDAGLSYSLSSILSTLALVGIVLFISWVSNLLAKTIILQVVTRIVKRTKSNWDDIFLEQKVFTRLSHFAPALVIWFMAGWALKAYPAWLVAVQKLTYIYMVLVGMVVINSFIESWHRIYLSLPLSQHRHIKGYVQVIKLLVALISILIIVSVVFRKEVSTIIAGLGAMAAVILLIFRDAILGLVASIQLSANNMLKIGDWITIPSRGADGNVEDITLTTVKVRNFDKTIIFVPVYALVSESFQSWKGMEEAGIRQVKRSVFTIDIRSVRFADDDLLNKLSQFPFVRDYLRKIEKETPESSSRKSHNNEVIQGKPQLTNLGLFRIYTEEYLRNHPGTDKNQTVLARHLEPAGNGLPFQIFAFSSNNTWSVYEHLQSEITEHLLSVLNEFGLSVFQQPSGADLAALSTTK